MTVQAVNAFQTRDKRLYTDEAAALRHELAIDIRQLAEEKLDANSSYNFPCLHLSTRWHSTYKFEEGGS